MKILDSNFRKDLYKNLVEAGYEKQEAQKIVGIKYFNALKGNVLDMVSKMFSDIESNNFQPLNEGFEVSFNEKIAELQKMNEYVNG